MTRSELALDMALLDAAQTAVRPVTQRLCKAIVVGRDRLRRVDRNSENCGRAWTLNKLRQSAREIRSALYENNGGRA